MGCFSCCISPLFAAQLASEQEKLPPPAIHVSIAAHRFQNDGLKKGWKGGGMRPDFLWILFEARPHKQYEEEQCEEQVCIVVVVVVVVGWEANEWNEGGNEHRRRPS